MKNKFTKVVYNSKCGLIQLSKEATDWMKRNGYQAKFCDHAGRLIVPRHNPVFIACVEELGDAASRDLQGTELRIAEIEGDRYYVFPSENGEVVITEKDLISSKGKQNQPIESFDPDKVWFTSDTHFCHENIMKFCSRPFKDIGEMNHELVRRWNETVPPDGVVFHLGDFAFASPGEWNDILGRLNGQIYLILGNHDFKQIKQGFMRRFAHVTQQMTIRVGGQSIVLNHNPFLCYAGSYNNVWQLFGHVHSGPASHCGLDHPRLNMLFPLQYDVGVDNNDFRPVSFKEVKERIEAQVQMAGSQKTESTSPMPSGVPVVFLDVDGVLVLDPTTRQLTEGPSSHLSWLLQESGAGLVIIGGWTAFDIEELKKGALKEYSQCLVGATPRASSYTESVAQWLSTSDGKHPYVILSSASISDDRAIAVNPQNGLSRDDVQKAIGLIGNINK